MEDQRVKDIDIITEREAVGILIVRRLKKPNSGVDNVDVDNVDNVDVDVDDSKYDYKVLLLKRGSGSKIGTWSMLSGEMTPEEIKNGDKYGTLHREIDEEIGKGNASKVKIMDSTLSELTTEGKGKLIFHYFVGVCYEDLTIDISRPDEYTKLPENTDYKWVDPCEVKEQVKPLFDGLNIKLATICKATKKEKN